MAITIHDDGRRCAADAIELPARPARAAQRRRVPALALALFAVLPAMAHAAVTAAVEYFHQGFGHYFVTAFAAEIAALDGGAITGWRRTGAAFDVESEPAAGLQPVGRFFSTSFGPRSSHFYTASAAEDVAVRTNPDWRFEALAFHVAPPATDGGCAGEARPVYRLYNAGRDGAPNHRYTTDPAVRAQMLAQGWVAEGLGTDGVVFCSPAGAAPGDPVSYAGSFPATTTEFTRASLSIGGLSRDSWVYRPSATGALPLLLLFTGTGGTLDYSLVDELGRGTLQGWADRNQVIVVAPLPRLMDRGDWDNHGPGTPYWETATGDGTSSPVSSDPAGNADLVLVRALIQEARRTWSADPQRVYAVGFSNGAFFAYFVAATLAERIAAFAETGGGLVQSGTTAGEPTACTPRVNPGAPGAIRNCLDAGWLPGTCQVPGAVARPIAPASVPRVPPGFLQSNDDDPTVPYAHSCNLGAALPASPDYVTRIVHAGGGHIVDAGFLDDAWAFMQGRRTATP